MKFIRFLGLLWFLMPCGVAMAVDADFQNASNLLMAARRGDTYTVQTLINSGVDVNYVDSTGLSLVCTAVMNNDKRAIQVLQMYGADASNCDKQIKQYKQKNKVAAKGEEYGFFSGLSSTHVIVLAAAGVAAVVGGVVLLSDVFDKDNHNGANGSNGDRPNNNNGGGSENTQTSKLFTQNLPYGPACSGSTCPSNFSFWENDVNGDFTYMSNNGFNYLMVARAYNSFVRGYLGQATVRNDTTKEVFDLSRYPFAQEVNGGKPINVAMITASGVNAAGSVADDEIYWFDENKRNSLIAACVEGNDAACQEAVDTSVKSSHKYYNLDTGTEDTSFDLSGSGSVFGSATDSDTKLAQIIAGWNGAERGEADFYGFIPNGQLTVYKNGTGEAGVSDYKNYLAMYQALSLKNLGTNVTNVVANLALVAGSEALGYPTVASAKSLTGLVFTESAKRSVYGGLIDTYYNLYNGDDEEDYGLQSGNAALVFTYLSNNQNHILINPAGHTLYGIGADMSIDAQIATFENFAPAVYHDSQYDLQNLFMTVVAVKPKNGTSGYTVSDYSPVSAGKLELSTWDDGVNVYSSRICGLTGTGNGGAMNPWCFAAPGKTDLEATAAMAGSVALVKSAFNYMTPKQIFLLLALTADGPYLGTDPSTGLAWTSTDVLVSYLQEMYTLPDVSYSESYLENFKNAFGYGMINLERATRPGTNIYLYSSDKNTIVSAGKNAYWRNSSLNSLPRASSVLSLTDRGTISTSFYDVIESADGSISLPRVWNMTFAGDDSFRRGFYTGDVLADFNIDSANRRTNHVGNFSFDMAMSERAYNDNLNGLDDLRVAFNGEKYDVDARYQRFLTDGNSRFDGRANGVLSLVANSMLVGAKYKYGNFAFGGRAFSGAITDETLLDKDPVVSSQFEPARLGLANGGVLDFGYDNKKFAFGIAVGNLHETDTVLGMYSDGLLDMRGGDTQYIDFVSEYRPFEKVRLSARGTFANTRVDMVGGIISNVSDIKSNAFAIGADVMGFEFTAAMPLATVSGKMGYDNAEFVVVENNGKYEVALNNPHVEYIDLAKQKRELRFSTSYKRSIGEFTDAGIGFIYRVNPDNTDALGNESIFMLKMHHRLGI